MGPSVQSGIERQTCHKSRPVSLGRLARQGTGARHGRICRSFCHSACIGDTGSRAVFFSRWLRTRWVNAGGERRGERIAIVLAGALAISSPYLLFKAYELHFVLSRVPEPLRVSWIGYRLEQSWGIGMPGDKETGFVVYRMTDRSAEWARNQGQNLGASLPGGSTSWHQTPVDESGTHNR